MIQPSPGRPDRRPSVMFVCVHNAGRSQLAAGWLRALAGEAIEIRSAGTAPADRVNPVAVEAMREVGIDITEARYLDWPLDDPAGQGIEAVRRIRDAIRAKVEELIADLLPERVAP